MTRLACGAVLAALALALSEPAHAGATYHNVPGTACAAFNNNQANFLERSHVRIYNPPTSPAALWVICPVQRVREDLASSADLPVGFVNTYWSNASTATSMSCIVREYVYTTLALPGTNDPVNQVSVTCPRPSVRPGYSSTIFAFAADSTSNYHYFTVACNLPPGTGINSIDFLQR